MSRSIGKPHLLVVRIAVDVGARLHDMHAGLYSSLLQLIPFVISRRAVAAVAGTCIAWASNHSIVETT